MKCPILSAPTVRTAFTAYFADVDCLKEECAWWDEEKNCCSVKVIAKTASRYLYKRTGCSE